MPTGKWKQDGAPRENAAADIKFYIDQIPKLPDSEDFLGDRFSTRKFRISQTLKNDTKRIETVSIGTAIQAETASASKCFL